MLPDLNSNAKYKPESYVQCLDQANRVQCMCILFLTVYESSHIYIKGLVRVLPKKYAYIALALYTVAALNKQEAMFVTSLFLSTNIIPRFNLYNITCHVYGRNVVMTIFKQKHLNIFYEKISEKRVCI